MIFRKRLFVTALAIFSQISTMILCLPSSFLVRSDRFREIEKLNTALFFFFFFFF